MESAHLLVLPLFCLALFGTEASQPAEQYWKSVWPNTPVPKALRDLLLPSSGTSLPIKVEDMQYWTTFFQRDLHPGKEMNLHFHKHPDVQPFGVKVWKKKERKTIEMEKHILEEFCGKETAAVGEDKYCATSLKSMMDFAMSKLGKNIRAISSAFSQNQEQYTVEEVKKVGERAVMCHRLNFQEVVFYCHEVNATTSYMVPLVASDGTKAKALTICHQDTRGMDLHVLYQVLKVKPGTVPVCHFVGNKAVAWVPNFGLNESDHPCVL